MFRSAPRPATQTQGEPSATMVSTRIESLPLGPDAGLSTSRDTPENGNTDVGVAVAGGSGESLWQKMVADNPYFSAGAGLMGIGVVLTVLRRTTTLAATLGQRRLLVTLEIPSKDRSYPWFLEWMAHQTPSPTAGSTSLVGRATSAWKGKASMSLNSHELAVETTYKQHENGSSEAVFNLVPGPGTHYFRYGGSWFQVKRERDAKLMDLHSGTPWETLTLTTLSSSRHLFSGLLAEARQLAEASTEGKTVVYTAWGVEWRPFGKPRRRREMGSVVLAEGIAERVEADVKGFLGRAKWYAERGIPYRRGYLLHGPPGSGKTSFIQALAGSLSYNICLLNLSERGLTDDKLNHLLGLVPERSFILLEDVDSAFNRREQTSEEGFKSSVTFSGLLNALDGVASSEERIIFMTTNHYERLDPALIRPGRVDIKELLGDAAGEQARRLFVKFYGRSNVASSGSTVSSSNPSGTAVMEKEDQDKHGVWREGEEVLSQEEVERLGGEVEVAIQRLTENGRGISMAALQGHFIRHSAKEAVDGISGLVKDNAR